MSVSQISDAFRSDILVCAIESRDNVSIPGGDHIIHDGDMVSILASPLNAADFSVRSVSRPIRSKTVSS